MNIDFDIQRIIAQIITLELDLFFLLFIVVQWKVTDFTFFFEIEIWNVIKYLFMKGKDNIQILEEIYSAYWTKSMVLCTVEETTIELLEGTFSIFRKIKQWKTPITELDEPITYYIQATTWRVHSRTLWALSCKQRYHQQNSFTCWSWNRDRFRTN